MSSSLPRAQRLLYTAAGSICLLAGALALRGGEEARAAVEQYQSALEFREKALASMIRVTGDLPERIPENVPVYLEGVPFGERLPSINLLEDKAHGVRFLNPEVRWYHYQEIRGAEMDGWKASPMYLNGVELPQENGFVPILSDSPRIESELEVMTPSGEYEGMEGRIEDGFLTLGRAENENSIVVDYQTFGSGQASALGAVKDGKLVPYAPGLDAPGVKGLKILRLTWGTFDPEDFLAGKLTVAPPPADVLARDRNRRKIFAPLLFVTGIFFWIPVIRGWLKRDKDVPRL